MTALPQDLNNNPALTTQNVKQNTPATQPAVNGNPSAPLPAPSTSLMINMKQTLGNIIPIDTSRTASTTTTAPATPVLVPTAASMSSFVNGNPSTPLPTPPTSLMTNLKQALESMIPTDTSRTASTATTAPVTPILMPTVVPMSSLLQSLNNKQQDKVEDPASIQGTGTINGLPEGDYAALSFALSVSAGALSAVSEALGLNAAQISVMNAAFGKGLEALYQQNMVNAQQTLDTENNKSHVGKVFGDIGKHVGQVVACAIIVAGIATGDPALVAVGCIALAMSINAVSSHVIDGVADGLIGMINGVADLEGHKKLARGVASAIIVLGYMTGDPALIAVGVVLLAMSFDEVSSHVKGIMPGTEREWAEGIATVMVLAATIAVCLAVGDVAGVEEAIEEGSTEIAEAESTGDALDTSSEAGAGAADMGSAAGDLAESVARIGELMQESNIESGEKTMAQLVQDAANSMLEFVQENPQRFVDTMKKAATAAQVVTKGAEGIIDLQLAKLSVAYGNAEATIQNVDFNFNILAQDNQLNTNPYEKIAESNGKMTAEAYKSAAEGLGAYSRI